MKLKKMLLLLAIPFMALTSCSSSSIYGKYSFKLGSTPESTIGVSLNLTQEIYEIPAEPALTSGSQSPSSSSSVPSLYNTKRVLDFALLTGGTSMSKIDLLANAILALLNSDVVTFDEIKELLSVFFSEEDLHLYYSLDEKVTNGKGNRMRIGTAAFSMILPPEISSELSEIIIESILVAFLSGNKISITMPVSFNDFLFQLCWYGLFIIPTYDSTGRFDNLIIHNLQKKDELPAGCGDLPGADGNQDFQSRVGTAPLVDEKHNINEVKEMNENFAPLFSQYSYTFRAAHLVPIELTKE